MAKLAAYPEPMNVAQFLAFNATRPDGEKWELIDGELFLIASPVNRVFSPPPSALRLSRRREAVAWEICAGRRFGRKRSGGGLNAL